MCVNDCILTMPKSSPPIHHYAWQLVWGICSDAITCFLSNMVLCMMTIFLHLKHISAKSIAHVHLWFVQTQFCKPKSCCHILFKGRRLFSATLSLKSYMFRSEFLVVWRWPHNPFQTDRIITSLRPFKKIVTLLNNYDLITWLLIIIIFIIVEVGKVLFFNLISECWFMFFFFFYIFVFFLFKDTGKDHINCNLGLEEINT